MKYNQTLSKLVLTTVMLLLVAAFASGQTPVLDGKGSDIEKAAFIYYQVIMAEKYNREYAEWSDALWLVAKAANSRMMAADKVDHDITLDLSSFRHYAKSMDERHLLQYHLYEQLALSEEVITDPWHIAMIWSTSKEHWDSIFHPDNRYSALDINYHNEKTYIVWYVVR